MQTLNQDRPTTEMIAALRPDLPFFVIEREYFTWEIADKRSTREVGVPPRVRLTLKKGKWIVREMVRTENARVTKLGEMTRMSAVTALKTAIEQYAKQYPGL